ncbi:DUF29 domain-containing protein [Sulfurihydrogenibium sp.]|uniref:DUF29 domain-containing protein n=1 Tax=Sulfurihydrogenibium sp. TaxID=2053621 RepID=UPI0026390979|nr:DUF29 domain-containing protein [Sulfurihydrogenibium sp.]
MQTINISKQELKQLYTKDYPLWVDINLQLLKDKAYELVDWDNLLEEIEDMGRSDLKACISYLAVILEHLYKLDNFKDLAGGESAGKSWVRSIMIARLELEKMFKWYPSLKTKLPSEYDKAWDEAVVRLKKWLMKNNKNPNDYNIPDQCPYTYQEAFNRQF